MEKRSDISSAGNTMTYSAMHCCPHPPTLPFALRLYGRLYCASTAPSSDAAFCTTLCLLHHAAFGTATVIQRPHEPLPSQDTISTKQPLHYIEGRSRFFENGCLVLVHRNRRK